jgi:hypothetical protein
MKYIITEEQFSTIQTKNPEFIIEIIKQLYNSMNVIGICEMDLRYNEEDNNFTCYLIIDKDWYTKNPDEKTVKNNEISEYRRELKEKIKNYLGITMYIGSYVSPLPCE